MPLCAWDTEASDRVSHPQQNHRAVIDIHVNQVMIPGLGHMTRLCSHTMLLPPPSLMSCHIRLVTVILEGPAFTENDLYPDLGRQLLTRKYARSLMHQYGRVISPGQSRDRRRGRMAPLWPIRQSHLFAEMVRMHIIPGA